MPILLLLLLLPLLVSGCDQEPVQPIQWQLPLTTAPDPHSPSPQATPPAWATEREGAIKLRLLSTSSGRQYTLLIPMRGEASVEDITVHLSGLAGGLRVHNGGVMFDDPEVTNPAAFITIRRGRQTRFSGWIYREFPEMFSPEIAGWKFFLDDATIRPASRDGEG